MNLYDHVIYEVIWFIEYEFGCTKVTDARSARTYAPRYSCSEDQLTVATKKQSTGANVGCSFPFMSAKF